MDPREAYLSGKGAVAGLVDESNSAVRVPSCPAWSVHDLVAHLVGLAEDVTSGNVDDYASDAWTAQQVHRRSDVPIDDMLADWDDLADELVDQFAALPPFLPPAIVVDVVEHEQDLHEALRMSDTDRHERVEVALASLIGGVRSVHQASGLPSYVIEATDWRSWAIGTGDPVGSLRAHSNLLLRALAGRRPRTEVAALDWTMDPEPYLDHLLYPTFRWPGARS